MKDTDLWCCPRCQGSLADEAGVVLCVQCRARYRRVGGILDLRLPGPTWIDLDTDAAAAERLAGLEPALGMAALVRSVFQTRPGWDPALVERRTQQVLNAPQRLRSEIHAWLRPCVADGGVFLDLGCGPGMLLSAVALEGWRGIGVDVSLVWLVVARRLIRDCGGEPVLAAAQAEALPLPADAVTGVVSLDVIEHVGRPDRYLAEIDRVTRPGGCLALSTPNRYSLAAEPHVSLWGVGWLPRRWQKRYVCWRGKSYESTRLLSSAEVGDLLRCHTRFRAQILLAPIPGAEIAQFPLWRAALAHLYNALVSRAGMRSVLLKIGPFFRVVGCKAP